MTKSETFALQGGVTRYKNMSLFVEIMTEAFGNSLEVMLLAIVLFISGHQKWKKDVLLKSPKPGSPARAVWLWGDGSGSTKFSAPVLLNPASYLTWAAQNGVNQTWIDVHSVITEVKEAKMAGKTDQTPLMTGLKDFCQKAKAQGMLVHFLALAHYPFAVADFLNSAMKQLVDVYDLIKKIEPGSRPVGIQSDIEPQALTIDEYEAPIPKNPLLWSNKRKVKVDGELTTIQDPALDKFVNKPEIVKQYVNNLAVLASLNQQLSAQLGQYMPLTVSVAFWWLGKSENLQKNQVVYEGKPLGEVICNLGLDVAVMDYDKNLTSVRDFAQLWIDSAEKAGQMAWIGLDTVDPKVAETSVASINADTDFLTNGIATGQGFTGSPALKAEKFAGFADRLSFATCAIHQAVTYANLP